jgi:hypothetical protein
MGDLGSGAGSSVANMASPEKGVGAEMLDDIEALMDVLKDKGAL